MKSINKKGIPGWGFIAAGIVIIILIAVTISMLNGGGSDLMDSIRQLFGD